MMYGAQFWLVFLLLVGGGTAQAIAKKSSPSCQQYLKKNTSSKTTPSKATPSKTTSSKAARSKTASSKAARPKAAPSKATPSKAARSKAASSKTAPSKTVQPKAVKSKKATKKTKASRKATAQKLKTKRTPQQMAQSLSSLFSDHDVQQNGEAIMELIDLVIAWLHGQGDGYFAHTLFSTSTAPKLRLYPRLIRQLLGWLKKEKLNLNTPGYLNQTLLHVAVRRGEPLLIEALIDAGADVLAQDAWQQTALHVAVQYKASFEVLSLLTPALDQYDGRGKTPLHLAVEQEDILQTEHLLELGAFPDIPDKTQSTPYFHAFRLQNLTLVQLLQEAGATARLANDNGITPLHLAVAHGAPELIKAALESGAPIDAQDHDSELTALHLAAHQADLASLKVLVHAGGDLNLKGRDGRSVWSLMMPFVSAPAFAHMMISTQARFDEMTDVLKSAIEHTRVELIGLLIQKGSSTEAVYDISWPIVTLEGQEQRIVDKVSALIPAIFKENGDPLRRKLVLEILLKYIDPNAHSQKYKLSPLIVATFEGNDLAVDALLQAGADVNFVHPHFGSALHTAVFQKHDDIVALLLAHGADTNLLHPYDQNTPLHIAVYQENLAAAAFILQNPHVNTELRNLAGLTAFEVAEQHNQEEMKMMLTHSAPHKFPDQMTIQ